MSAGSTFVTIDSRDRERAADSPGNYSVRLLEDVRDVCTVKLRSADIPPMWNVPIGRSSIWVSTGGGALEEAVLEPSDHTEATLAAAAEAALDAVTPLTWTVTVGATGRFEFSATGAFTLRGGDGSHADGYGPTAAGRVLGLAPTEEASDGGNSLTAPHRNQLDRPDTMYLHVEDFDAVHGASSRPAQLPGGYQRQRHGSRDPRREALPPAAGAAQPVARSHRGPLRQPRGL